MILQALNDLYGRLARDEESGIPRRGYSAGKIGFCLVLDNDGTLVAVEDVRDHSGKKPVPRIVEIPEAVKRASGIAANFLCDNPGYVLGLDDKGKPERALATFEAFKAKQREVAGDVDDEGMQAVLAFLDSWSPARGDTLQHREDMAAANLTFRLDGERRFVFERPSVTCAWQKYKESNASRIEAFCLVSGETRPVARLHPAIKGVRGSQTTGAALSSFNIPSFLSYDKEQNYNAPVGEAEAFAYTTALNHLLARGSRRRVQVADATTVFWAERKSGFEELFGLVLDPAEVEDDSATAVRLKSFLEAVRQGRRPPEIAADADVRFYVLGLAPNASRLAVRFWCVDTVAEMSRRLGEHFADLEIERRYPSEPEFPSPRQLLLDLAPLHDYERIPPPLAAALLRAVMGGGRYPAGLLAAAITRIRADHEVTRLRAGVIKACLARSARLDHKPEVFTVSLDTENRNAGYLMGRLFAVLEKAQQDALPGINATIKDRFFGAASATPAAAFPRLIRLAQHHMAKAEYGAASDRRLAEVMEQIEDFPAHLSLEDQGRFALGYYQQRNTFYPKKNAKDAQPAATPAIQED